MRIYLTLIQLHSESLLPLNLFRRIYKRIDRQELLTRFEAISKEEGFQ